MQHLSYPKFRSAGGYTLILSLGLMSCAPREFNAMETKGSPEALGQGKQQRFEIGRSKSRAILNCIDAENAPLAIVIPGTGAHGPEEAMPGAGTFDGKDTEILTSFAQGLRKAGFHTLQLGKPGIEFHTSWDVNKLAYDAPLFLGLTWHDLIDNVNEGVAFASERRLCGASRIVLAGHSEGTMVTYDVAAENPKVRGLIFFGLQGFGARDSVEWQAFSRQIEFFLSTDVDSNKDRMISREEAARWPNDFAYPWKDGETEVSFESYAANLRISAATKTEIEKLANSKLYSNGIWERGPQFSRIASLSVPVLAFTGELDVQTPPSELKELNASCKNAGKTNCQTYVYPGVGHFFSPPKAPRGQALLDATVGPVSDTFVDFLSDKAAAWRMRELP